eukprot:m.199137 g.199137  ORF g.199137 m.199137 type:complete len:92 (+) comp18776_c0_seq1:98-373(+)
MKRYNLADLKVWVKYGLNILLGKSDTCSPNGAVVSYLRIAKWALCNAVFIQQEETVLALSASVSKRSSTTEVAVTVQTGAWLSGKFAGENY